MSAASGRGPQRVTVRIQHNPGDTPSVDQDSVHISATEGDEVEWICDAPDKDFHVRFQQESPFEQNYYHRNNNRTGRVKSNATGTYKYSVDIDGKILDPTVIVHPP
jgi:plastocyanin